MSNNALCFYQHVRQRAGLDKINARQAFMKTIPLLEKTRDSIAIKTPSPSQEK